MYNISFLRARVSIAIARISCDNFVCPSVRLSVLVLKSEDHHRLNGSSSPVLTATSLSKFNPPQIQNP